MWISNLFSCIGFKAILLSTIFLLIGYLGKSHANVPTIEIKEEDPQLERTVDLSFSLRGVVGNIFITVSTKHAPQMIGVEKADLDGAIKNIKFSKNEDWRFQWKTRTINGKENGIEFPDTFQMKFNFIETQIMKFEVINDETKKTVGTYITYLADIARNIQTIQRLGENTEKGWEESDKLILIRFKENLDQYNDQVAYELEGEIFEEYDSMYPYVTISKEDGNSENGEINWKAVDKTFMVGFENKANPKFLPLSVRVSHITDEKNEELQLKFTCMLRDIDNLDNAHVYLGEFQTSYLELKEGESYYCVPQGSNAGKNMITIKSVKKVATFLEIAQSGLDIQVSVSIDFTLSNSWQETERSQIYGMHGVEKEGYLNRYEQAMTPIIQIVEHFDSDKKIPLMGFGGRRICKDDRVNHCFALRPLMGPDKNGKELDEYCYQTLGVLETYRYVMLNGLVQLSGPTHYANSIKHIADQACEKKGKNDTYFLLVLLTDGDYADEDRTKGEIAKASECPMSIILVGIGKGPFEKLKDLDADDGIPLKGKDEKGNLHIAKADIVQRVEYQDYYNLETEKAMKGLVDETLREFPVHIQNYFKMYNLSPKEHSDGINLIESVVPTPKVANHIIDLSKIMLNY